MTPRRRKLRIIHFRRGGENSFAPLLILSHLNPLTRKEHTASVKRAEPPTAALSLGFKWVPWGLRAKTRADLQAFIL